MGVSCYEFEVNSPVPPSRLFKAVTVEAPNVWPKAVPQLIKSVELEEGDGGPGSVAKINFADGHPIQYAKNKIEAVDIDNCSYSYSVVEGGFLGGKLEKISYENKLVAGANGGSLVKSVMKYHTSGDSVYSEEEHKALVDKTEALYKPLEVYLMANLDVCN